MKNLFLNRLINEVNIKQNKILTILSTLDGLVPCKHEGDCAWDSVGKTIFGQDVQSSVE